MSLTKTLLIRSIANDTGYSQRVTANLLSVLFDVLKESLAKGESISIRGFGKFYVIDQKERKIRHPSTGKKIIIEPKKHAKFKLFRSLNSEINKYDEFRRQNKKTLEQLHQLIENSPDEDEWEEEHHIS
jgi:nucleoid DNA-binding protein